MKTRTGILLLLLLLPLTAHAESGRDGRISGRVLNVTYDGMLVMAVDVRAEVVKLHGVEVAETGGDAWRKIRLFCRKQVQGRNVFVETMGRDHWGRTLGRVYVDGDCLNDMLKTSGLLQPRTTGLAQVESRETSE